MLKSRAQISSIWWIYPVLEGAALISIEILGAKLITPFFGSAWFTWVSVVGLTMLGLAIGYFLGSWLVEKKKSKKILAAILFFTGLWVFVLPEFSFLIIEILLHNFTAESSISIILMNLFTVGIAQTPAIVLISTIPPLLIDILSKKKENAGWNAGKIFGVSTVSSIVLAIVLGFWLIPLSGVQLPCRIIGVFLILYSLLFFMKHVNLYYLIGFISCISVWLSHTYFFDDNKNENFKLVYESNGLLGEIKIFDDFHPKVSSQIDYDVYSRFLVFNGVNQTKVFHLPEFPNKNNRAKSKFLYTHKIASLTSYYPRESKVLLLGLGGGSIGKELYQMGFQVTAVDIDNRMYDIAKNYFYFNEDEIEFVTDDARHYLNQSNKKFDIIISDICKAESQPVNLLTKEGFEIIKQRLSDEGMFSLVFQGYIKGEKSKGFQAIVRTLDEVGFILHYSFDKPIEDSPWDVQIIATKKPIKEPFMNVARLNICCREKPEIVQFADTLPAKLEPQYTVDPFILEDNRPVLDYCQAPTIYKWRINMIKNLNQE